MVRAVAAPGYDDVTAPADGHVVTSLSKWERKRVPRTVTGADFFVLLAGATQITAPRLRPDGVLLLTWT